jgi:hypothetical protein
VVLASVPTAAPAQAAATGRVVVFNNEVVHLTVYEDPSGCYALPVGAHVVTNLTNGDIRIYADLMCLSPSLTVKPGYGSHVSAVGSFSG